MKRVVKDKGLKKVCTVYQDDDFGLEVMHGGEQALKDLGMTYAEKTTYKRGATDFASQVAKMKEAGCDGVVMGTIIRETIGVIGTGAQARLESGVRRHHGELFRDHPQARRRGGERLLLDLHHQLPLCGRPESEKVREWFATYKGKFNEDPTVLSAYGYQLTNLFVEAANEAGKDLNPDTLASRDRDLTKFPADFFGGDEQTFSATKHLGSDRAMLCQIQDGKWKSVSEYLTN